MKEIENTESNLRLDIFINKNYIDLSRNKIQKLIIEGKILINGSIVKPSYLLKGNEKIIIKDFNLDSDNFKNVQKQDLKLNILYEDKSIIVINKKSGIVVHPGIGNKSGTLLNGLLYHFDNLSNINSDRPGIVHRLDRDTSGVIIIAKDDDSHNKLSFQFSNREVKKVYRAIVWGRINNQGKIEGYLTRDNKNRTCFVLNDTKGKYSYTEYNMISEFNPFSYIELYPLTGRTHQLRAHLKSIGHPILLDENYGGGKNRFKSYNQKYYSKIDGAIKLIDRFALHAYKITIKHPKTNNQMEFVAPMPKDIKEVLQFIDESE